MAKTNAGEDKHDVKVLGKLLSYSLVATIWQKTLTLYDYGKTNNAFLSRALPVIEKNVTTAATIATPYVKKFEEPLRKLDTAVVTKMDAIEKTASHLTELPKRGIAQAQRLFASVVHFAYSIYAHLLGTVNTIIDRVLPPKANDPTSKESPSDVTIRTVTHKLKQRIADRLGNERLKPVASVFTYANEKFGELLTAIRTELKNAEADSSKSDANADEHSAANKALPYGVHDLVLVARAVTNVTARYTSSFLRDLSNRYPRVGGVKSKSA